MIIFKKVRYKNLLSTGNVFTEIDLNRDRTTMISGENGAGKSTILDAITFALYGKPFRKITKPQLVNTINQKEMLVEIEFDIGKHAYKVRRGIKPNVFEVYKNDKLVDQNAATKDYQAYLEQNILKINLKAFNQIVVLGAATYVPFMQLTAANRREVIEDLLDIQVFSTMNTLLKDRVSTNKSDVIEAKHDIELLESKIESAKEHNESIRKMRLTEANKIKDKVKDHLDKIETETATIKQINDQIATLNETVSDKGKVETKLTKMGQLKQELTSKQRAINEELKFYHDNDNCPTCKQGIDHEFKKHTTDEKTESAEQISGALEQLQGKVDELQKRLDEIADVEAQVNKLSLKAGEHRANVNMSKNALASYKKELQDAERQVEEVDNGKLDEYNKQLGQLRKTQKQLLEEKDTLAVVASMLKDGGIKTRIIKQYIPIINQLINKYLSEFELFVDFQLDENFNEQIKSRHRDSFSYESFSEGEKLRISLSIMLTWRAVSKMRNSVSTNLVILDETLDGSADESAVESLIEMLHNLNPNDNVFVISHRGAQFGDKFASSIRFEKVRNFSQIAS